MQPQTNSLEDLLLQPISSQITYFKDYTVAHPKLIEADRKLMHAIREPGVLLLID